jgi:DNA-nicking Smr family endonuclease
MATDRKDAKRPRRLSDEDAELWDRVARTAKPLKRRRAESPPLPAEGRQAPAPEAERQPQRPRREPAPHAPRQPPLARFDPKEARQLAGGKLRIEARVDLHGLTQREAHAKLRSFLADAQAKGRRHVLVITGKGTPRSEGEQPFWEGRDRGVLRRLVPQWLSEPELRAVVVGFTTAQVRHGGEGALYVRLRRSR